MKKDPTGYWYTLLKGGAGSGSWDGPGQPRFEHEYTSTPKTASELYGKVPMENGKPVPITTKVGYHVTTREKAEAILKGGFSLEHTKPRWINDYATSVSMGSAKSAAAYFAKRGESLDMTKYALLKVTFKGRMAGDVTQTPSYARDAKDYNRQMQKEGYDAHVMKGQAYIYNTRAITKITEEKVS